MRNKDHLDPIGPDEEDETRLFALLLSHVDRAIEKMNYTQYLKTHFSLHHG